MLKNRLQNYLNHLWPVRHFYFHQPVVLFHSDDWGLAGIPTSKVYARLKKTGISLGENPWDTYSLEKAEDLTALYDVLMRHHDSHGRSPTLVFNFVLTNVDFPQVIKNGFSDLLLRLLREGIPEPWDRPGLFDAYREGIRRGFVYPALHGNTHFNAFSARSLLHAGGKHREVLTSLYREGVSQLHSRTPWLGFEYRAENEISMRPWLSLEDQKKIVTQGIEEFERTFGVRPLSTCAPGYRANEDTWRAWAGQGLRVAQEGPGLGTGPYQDQHGLIHLPRTVSLEPALRGGRNSLSEALRQVRSAFARGWPAVVCMHSINFQSGLVNHRDHSLILLHQFLAHLGQQYKDLSYLHDGDLVEMIGKHLSFNHGSNLRSPLTHSLGLSPVAKRIFQTRFRPGREGRESKVPIG
jgi:hypothetical protein